MERVISVLDGYDRFGEDRALLQEEECLVRSGRARAARLFMVKEVRTARASIFTRLTSLTLQQKVE